MYTNLKKLIEILSDGEFHSGEKLGSTLGLTRSAIWKLIKQFPEWDLQIDSVTGKGYCIPGGLELLDKNKILNALSLPQKQIMHTLELFDSLPSTNDYLLQKIQESRHQPMICFAERQTSGKGRRGRHWVSPFAKNIYLSILWHFPHDPSKLSGLSLATATAVIQALNHYNIKEHLALKWPNDVLWKNQKLSGILIELNGETNDICSAVIGVGLNIDMTTINSQNIHQPWTDVKQIIQKTPNRNQLSGILLNELIKTLTLFQEKGLTPFIEFWNTLDMTAGQKVTLSTPHSEFQGIGRGINENGHFLLEDDAKQLKSFSSGEVSLRLFPSKSK